MVMVAVLSVAYKIFESRLLESEIYYTKLIAVGKLLNITAKNLFVYLCFRHSGFISLNDSLLRKSFYYLMCAQVAMYYVGLLLLF